MFLLVPAHLGFPRQIPQSRKTVVCVCVSMSKLISSVIGSCAQTIHARRILHSHSMSSPLRLFSTSTDQSSSPNFYSPRVLDGDLLLQPVRWPLNHCMCMCDDSEDENDELMLCPLHTANTAATKLFSFVMSPLAVLFAFTTILCVCVCVCVCLLV